MASSDRWATKPNRRSKELLITTMPLKSCSASSKVRAFIYYLCYTFHLNGRILTTDPPSTPPELLFLITLFSGANAKRPQLRRIKEAIEKLIESSEEESEGTSLSGSLGTRSKLSKGGSSKGGSKGGSSKGGSKSGYSRDKYSTSKSSKKGEKGSKSKSSVSSSDTPTKPSYDRRKYEKKKAAGGKSVSSSDTPTKSGYDPSKYQKKGQQTKTMTL